VIGQCPQEGPQLVALQLPQLPPLEVLPTFPEKADIRRLVWVDLHPGQAAAVFWSLFQKRTSKVCPHFRHLNS
jgi:hypothetical protein